MDDSKAAPVTGPEAATLGALSERPAATTAALESDGGSGAAARSLLARGLVSRDELEMDGRSESLWALTDAGRELCQRLAPGGRKVSPNLGGLVPWFGAARKTASFFGNQLKGCRWVGVPFAGSFAEVPGVLDAGAYEVVCNDAHRGLINLARVSADSNLGPRLYRRLRRQAFAPETLADCQLLCSEREPDDSLLDFEHASAFFVCAWAGRSANAGTAGELRGNLAVRWDAGGGASAWRFSGAAWSIRDWRRCLRRCVIISGDAFEFLERCKDDERGHCGIYCDPPWFGPGSGYKHNFGKGDEEEANHRRLHEALDRFKTTRVVLRTGGDELTRSLYLEDDRWKWLGVDGRDQANARKQEFAVVRNGPGR